MPHYTRRLHSVHLPRGMFSLTFCRLTVSNRPELFPCRSTSSFKPPLPFAHRDSNAGRTTPRTENAVLRSALVSVGFQLSRCHCQLEDFLAHEDTLKL